jgi:hypothetical protein
MRCWHTFQGRERQGDAVGVMTKSVVLRKGGGSFFAKMNGMACMRWQYIG